MCPDTHWVHLTSIPLRALLPRCALTLSEFIVHPSLYMPSFQDVPWHSVSSSYIHPSTCPPSKMCPDTQWVHSTSIPLHALLPRCALTLSEFIVHPSLYMPSFQDVPWHSLSSSYIHPSTCPPSKMCPDTQWVHSTSIPLHALLPRCALTLSEFIVHPSLYMPSFQDVPWHSVSS